MLVECNYKILTPKKPSPAQQQTQDNPRSGGDHHVSRGEFLAWLQKGSEKALDVKKATKSHGCFSTFEKKWSQRFQEEIRCFSRREKNELPVTLYLFSVLMAFGTRSDFLF